MPGARRQQGDILWLPALIQQALDPGVRDLDSVGNARRYELDLRPVRTAQQHRGGCQWYEAPRDLSGVAQVVVEHQRHEGKRWVAEASEDTLPFVAVRKEASCFFVA